LNQGHTDFQSVALPTELSRHLVGGLFTRIAKPCQPFSPPTRPPAGSILVQGESTEIEVKIQVRIQIGVIGDRLPSRALRFSNRG